MTRAAHAVLDGRILDAFRFNPLGMILLPLALLVLSIEAVYWVLGKPRTWKFPVGKRGAVAIAVALISFGILRNLPWWPLTLLAPP